MQKFVCLAWYDLLFVWPTSFSQRKDLGVSYLVSSEDQE